ncbi:hypothetical protein DID75_01870 [Candidatus Marinamargulisbacteria bacterium SCGC AG-410-N11]|nr:hypothetical protein DID75_01870 [Candidatus Marinamargulisbacteria bacterium SCGC AG-410-N11]
MTKVFYGIILCLIISIPCFAQADNVIEDILYDSSAFELEKAIKDSAKKHMIYSYNISNAGTEGFEPILLQEDERELMSMVPKDSDYFSKVLIEHMTTKMARNSRRQAAFYAIYRKKIDIYKQVASLGKK